MFLGRKIWQVFFVWLDLRGDLRRDFLGIQNNLKPVQAWKFVWNFLGLIFGPGFFGGFVRSPRDFSGF